MKQSLVNWSNLDHPALLTDHGDFLTYGQLHDHVVELSKVLKCRQLVFLLGRNDIATLQTYLACFESGSVPLLLSSDTPSEILLNLLNVYQPQFIFLPKNLLEVLNDFQAIKFIDDYVLCRQRVSSCIEFPADLALLLATSGSTGSPKLVRLSWNNILSNAESISSYLNLTPSDRPITTLPFNYSYGMSVVNSHLYAGSSILLTNRGFFDPVFWRQMKSCRVTSMAGVPYSYEMLMKLRFERMTLPDLRTLTQAGGKLPATLARRVFDICHEKNIRFFTMYGQTEASPRIAYLSPEQMPSKLGSIGKAVAGGRLWLEDEQGREIQAADQVGELIYSGPNVALGYAENQEDLMRGDDWGGVLRTGDLAKQDKEGYFYIEGRSSRFLKIYGVRIALDAVESWFAQRSIVAAAHGRDDHLYVTLESGLNLSGQEQVAALALSLQIHPTALTVTIVDQLPRLSSGKVDYSCLNSKH